MESSIKMICASNQKQDMNSDKRKRIKINFDE